MWLREAIWPTHLCWSLAAPHLHSGRLTSVGLHVECRYIKPKLANLLSWEITSHLLCFPIWCTNTWTGSMYLSSAVGLVLLPRGKWQLCRLKEAAEREEAPHSRKQTTFTQLRKFVTFVKRLVLQERKTSFSPMTMYTSAYLIFDFWLKFTPQKIT